MTRATVVYRFRVYDVNRDDYVVSTRMATLEKIEQIGGEPIRESESMIDETLVVDGWTAKNYIVR